MQYGVLQTDMFQYLRVDSRRQDMWDQYLTDGGLILIGGLHTWWQFKVYRHVSGCTYKSMNETGDLYFSVGVGGKS